MILTLLTSPYLPKKSLIYVSTEMNAYLICTHIDRQSAHKNGGLHTHIHLISSLAKGMCHRSLVSSPRILRIPRWKVVLLIIKTILLVLDWNKEVRKDQNTISMEARGLQCSRCKKWKEQTEYSKTQAKKNELRICKTCQEEMKQGTPTDMTSTHLLFKPLSGVEADKKDKMMCLSMHQPWASLLVYGIKRVEGRGWNTDFRGRLWIHAGKFRKGFLM